MIDLGYYYQIAPEWLLRMKVRFFMEYYAGFAERARSERERVERARKRRR